MNLRRRPLLAGLALAPGLAPLARAQGWMPDRPLRLVIPYAPGGTTDLFGRLLAQRMGERLGQRGSPTEGTPSVGRPTVVAENRAGAGGSLAAEHVANAKPDGYTLLVGSNGPMAINPLIQARPGYDPFRQLAPVGLGIQVPMALVVRAEVPVRTAAEFVAHAKAQPGRITMGSSGTGSSNQMAVELFNAVTGAGVVHVPYRGSGPMIPDLLAGNLASLMDQLTTALPLLRDGKVRLLALTSARRSSLVPEVPTLAEAGWPGAEMTTYNGLVAPAGLPAPVLAALARALRESLADPGLRERLEGLGAEVTSGELATPEGFAAFLREDFERMRRAVQLAGLKPE